MLRSLNLTLANSPSLPSNATPQSSLPLRTVRQSQALRRLRQTAIDKEYNAIIDRHIWDLVPLPPGRKPIGCQYVFGKKYNAHGSLGRYKARLVARGDSQKEGIDYVESYAPIARSDTFRILMSITAVHDWHCVQVDIVATFLYSR